VQYDAATGTYTCTTDQNLNDSVNMPGTFTGEKTRASSNVLGNNVGHNFQITLEPGSPKPTQNGRFSLVDDDRLRDGQDVPMPGEREKEALKAAMKEAYVEVLFDVGDNNNFVPFQLNMPFDILKVDGGFIIPNPNAVINAQD
ncbi:MAG: hypothetical protein NZ781_07500, partial [Armatimonadetes bacterium]|nr:hypothetical protein [Armatimonadota bacterium]